MSYGTAAGVAALSGAWTNSGVFDNTTLPTITTVTGWLAEISALVNIALASSGFQVPVTDLDVTPALDGLVNSMAADLVRAANNTGRFFTDRAQEYGISPIKVINNDVKAWVEANAAGLVAIGASRPTPGAAQAAYRETDERGNATFPIFQRDAFNADWRNTDI